MVCEKCGTENQEGATFCKECGNALVKADKNTSTSMPSLKISKKLIIILAVIVAAIVAVLIIVPVVKGRPVGEKKIIEDVKEYVMSEKEDVQIDNVEIVSRETGDEQDIVTVETASSNGKVQYVTKYEACYLKTKGSWSLEDIDMKNQSVYPLVGPEEENVVNDFKEYLKSKKSEDLFDEIKLSTKEPVISLSENEANYYLSVTKDSAYTHSYGEVKVKYYFYSDWKLDSYELLDSYKTDYDICYSWSGKVNEGYYGKYDFELDITGVNDNQVTANLIENGETHQLVGKIENYYSNNSYLNIDFSGAGNEVYRIPKCQLNLETGEITGTLYRVEKQYLYVGSNFSELKLSIINK